MRKYIFTGLSDYPLQITGLNFSVDPAKSGHGFTATIKAKYLRFAVDFIENLFYSNNIRFSFDAVYSVVNSKGVTSYRILRNCSR